MFEAVGDFWTTTDPTKSGDRLRKSKVRPPPLTISLPLSSVFTKEGLRPRTLIVLPVPRFRVIWTPVTRWSDSAILVSGYLPMSSAAMTSLTVASLRLMFAARSSYCRKPLTTTSLSSSSGAETGA
jgi:hypothetical protein